MIDTLSHYHIITWKRRFSNTGRLRIVSLCQYGYHCFHRYNQTWVYPPCWFKSTETFHSACVPAENEKQMCMKTNKTHMVHMHLSCIFSSSTSFSLIQTEVSVRKAPYVAKLTHPVLSFWLSGFLTLLTVSCLDRMFFCSENSLSYWICAPTQHFVLVSSSSCNVFKDWFTWNM